MLVGPQSRGPLPRMLWAEVSTIAEAAWAFVDDLGDLEGSSRLTLPLAAAPIFMAPIAGGGDRRLGVADCGQRPAANRGEKRPPSTWMVRPVM